MPKKFDYNLLQEVRSMYSGEPLKKNAFVPPPQVQDQQNQDQVMQMVQQGVEQGVPPEQIAGQLQQQGVPPEVIDQAMQQVPPPEPPPPPPDIREVMTAKVEEEKRKLLEQRATPEDRIFTLEKKVDVLTDMVQELIGGMPPKQSCDKQYYESILGNLKYEE